MAQTSPILYRALIRTHHMTSRKKIAAITKAAKHWNCAVYVKTGTWRGIMMGECEEEDGLKGWVGDVKRLRYKDYRLIVNEPVQSGRLSVPFGSLREFETMKALAADLDDCGILDWWVRHMGFSKGEDDESV